MRPSVRYRFYCACIGGATLIAFSTSMTIAGSGKLSLGECASQKQPEGSWSFRYCEIRHSYLDLVIMGGVADPDLVAIEKIEGIRQQCLFREEGEGCLSKREIQETIANLRRDALPTLIEKMGHYDGVVTFKKRAKELLDTFDFLCREPCNEQAVRAYTTQLPILLK